jgi:hypothetical protein
VWWGDLKKTYHLEDLGIDGRIYLQEIRRAADVDGVDLAEDVDK